MWLEQEQHARGDEAATSPLSLTESAHGAVDVAGGAHSVHVGRPDNKLVLSFR